MQRSMPKTIFHHQEHCVDTGARPTTNLKRFAAFVLLAMSVDPLLYAEKNFWNSRDAHLGIWRQRRRSEGIRSGMAVAEYQAAEIPGEDDFARASAT